MNVFLAGPFFNEESCSLLEDILRALESEDHEVFCAMRDGKKVPKDAPEEMRQKYFSLDVHKLHWCDCLVACLSYPMPKCQGLYIHEMTEKEKRCRFTTMRPLQLPDSGTVFEMGLAYALQKPILGFTAVQYSLNLMLAQSCQVICTNNSQLLTALYYVEEKDKQGLEGLKKETMDLFQM